ncbi:MAG: two-component regulator propeller domain-containing protein [Acidobacteriota bacterium]
MFLAILVVLFETTQLPANGSRLPIQLVVDEWLVKDGLPPGGIRSIVQTPDGYLWLASSGGLVRFDGVRFSPSPELQKALGTEMVVATALLLTRDGALWVAGNGFLCRLKDGHCSVFKGEIVISCLEESVDGSIWVGLNWAGLRRFKDGRFVNYPAVTGLIRAIHEDRRGNVWLGGIWDGLYRLTGTELTGYKTRDGLDDPHISSIVEDQTGTLWVATRRGLNRFSSGKFVSAGVHESVTSLWEDRKGVLWVGKSPGSISRLVAGEIERVPEMDRLDNDVNCLYEDREGSIWVGTNDGLNRLRKSKFRLYTTREGLANNRAAGIIEAQDGTVWVFCDGGGLSAIKDGRIQIFTTREGLASNFGGSLFQSRDGSIWAGTANGLTRIRNGKIISFSEGLLAHNYVSAIFEDEEGLVIAIPTFGLFHFDNGRLQPFLADQIGESPFIYQAYRARDGTVWLASGAGLITIKGHQCIFLTHEDGLLDNNVHSVGEDLEGTLWLATAKAGVACLKDGRVLTLSMKEGLYDDRVIRILPDQQGNLWMACPRGVFRVSRKQIDDYLHGRVTKVDYIAYGTADGMKSSECSYGAQTPGCRTRDGLLWFPTTRGVVSVDPGETSFNLLPPPVAIEQLVVDDDELPPAQNLELPPGRRRIEFRFTGLSLLVPEKVQFKYRLEGFDQRWLSAGDRRAAYYTNVPPGSYRFHVIASNNDGVWNQTGASLNLRLKPYFYQTPYFLAIVFAVLALAAGGVYRLRMFELKKRYQAVLEERNRIARDMHDTFAQNLGGVALQLDSIKMQFNDIPPLLLQKLDQTSRMIRYSLAEAYRAVRDLRAQILETREFAEALPEIAEQTTAGSDVTLDIRVNGTPRKLPSAAEDNLLRIFQEMMSNAVKHARARKIRVELNFGPTTLTLRVTDDGCGFEAEKAFSLGEGHYGLLGMQERVERLGGRMSLTSRPGQGTEVLVEVPITI